MKKKNYICQKCRKECYGYGKKYCKSCNLIFINDFNSKRDLKGKNPAWKGEGVGYPGVHSWIRKNKPKPKFCEDCGKEKRLFAANVSGKYLRDINDYKWLCQSCHSKMDGFNVKGYKGKDYKESIGSSNGRAKLNEKKVLEIKQLLREGKLTKTKIAEMYNVSTCPISYISNNKLWKHVQ